MQHRARDLLLRQQTQVINALRAHLAELGIVAAQGREGLKPRSKVTATCGVFLWSGRIPCCGGPSRTRRNILG
jgi:transposase